MSVDLRTRTDGPAGQFDAAQFFGHDLPAALDAQSDAVAPGTRWLDLRPMTIDADGDAWTMSVRGERVEIAAGSDSGAARVHLAPDQLDDLVHDQQTFMGMWSGGRLDQPAGRLGDALDWWLVLRAALDGRPIYEPGAVAFRDRDGSPIDLGRTFGVEDDRDDMRHFLEEAGYLHVEGVFSEDEMRAVSEDMDRAAPTYDPDDGHSWWAKTSDGERKLVRMQGFDERSPATGTLIGDRRFLGLAEIPGDGHVFGARSNNRIEALFKPIGVVEGSPTCPGTRTAASAGTPTSAAASRWGSRSREPTRCRASCACAPGHTAHSSGRRSTSPAATCPWSTCPRAPATCTCT